jgi:hypothetical protein
MMKTNNHNITLLNIAEDWKSNLPISIKTIDQMRMLLNDFVKQQQPGFVELNSSVGSRLQLGVGRQFACAQFVEHKSLPPYLCAKTKMIRADKDIEFLCGGTPSPIPPELCLSFDEAAKIAEYFFEVGERDPDFEWIEI